MPKERRPIQMKFRVNEKEREVIQKKMNMLGITNGAAYLRKMAIDGYVLRLEIPELKELIAQTKHIGNNVNQIAKVANAAGTVAQEDILGIKTQLKSLWNGINGILGRLNQTG